MKRGPYKKTVGKAAPPAWRRTYLLEWRTLRGLTQEELADAAGLSIGMVSSLEAANSGYSAETLHKLARALKVEPGMILSVNPAGDAPLWSIMAKATDEQKEQIARHADVIIAKKRRKT